MTATNRRLDRSTIATFVCLAVACVGFVSWRAVAVADARTDAIASAEEHFADLVGDGEEATKNEAALLEYGLRATVEHVKPGLDAAHLSDDAARFGVSGGNGYLGLVAVSTDDVLVSTAGLDGLTVPAISVTEPDRAYAASVTAAGRELVVVTVRSKTDAVLHALFDADRFLLQTEAHHVVTTLEPVWLAAGVGLEPGPDALTIGGSAISNPDAGAEHGDEHGDEHGHDHAAGHGDDAASAAASDDMHAHGDDVLHDHSPDARFEADRPVSVLEGSWKLRMSTAPGFIELPANHEVLAAGVAGALLTLGGTAVVGWLGASRRRAQVAAAAQAARFDVGFERSPIGVIEMDDEGAIVAANSAANELVGRGVSSLVGSTLVSLVSAESRSDYLRALDRLEDHGEAGSEELRLDAANHLDAVWVRLSVVPVVSASGAPGKLVQLIDVTEQRRVRLELSRRALHDDLTGLPNRTLLLDRLEQAIARDRRTGRVTAALFVDLDGFKSVNDSRGHGAGDDILQLLAERLRSSAREADTVARFGGDEFVVLCADLEDVSEADVIAQRLLSIAREPFEIDGETVRLSLSVGVAVAGEGADAEVVLRDADLAMYEAKTRGRDRAVRFEPGLRSALVDRLGMETALQDAVDAEDLTVYFQPLLDVATNDVVGFEALVRWVHPERGLITPDVFLPVAEALGLLPTIDRFVFRRAVESVDAWSSEFGRDLTVAVNAGPTTISDPDYARFVKETLRRTELAPEQVAVEVTEQQIVGLDAASAVIDELREFGVRVAIDDFGTGHSSFAQIATLSFDVLKIDRSLVNQLGSKRGGEIVRAVIDMARTLGVVTVAEGVETDDDLQRLRAMGSDVVQGFFIGRPMPGDSVDRGIVDGAGQPS